MLDFSSALYLGLRHATRSIQPWPQFTTGKPAALHVPSAALIVARELAALQGCERATLGPSTLHLFFDLFGMLSNNGVTIYMDEGVYPIVRWCVERAATRGIPIWVFSHHDVDALRHQLNQSKHHTVKPLVVSDGFCPGCGRSAPIADYLETVLRFGGRLILDDTQALGILGHDPEASAPYGRGGGGSLRWSNVEGSNVISVSSLAKGFGVPLAVLAGNRETVRWFEANSKTRIHCSPPSIAVLHAVKHTLDVNREYGDALRLRLVQLVRHFRNRLAEHDFFASGGLFPVQTLAPLSGMSTMTLHERLQRLGIRTVLHRPKVGKAARLSFLITARHRPCEIDFAIKALAHAAGMKSVYSWKKRSLRKQLT